MATTFSTTPSDWQGVDDVPTAGSDNLIKSKAVFDVIGGESVIPLRVSTGEHSSNLDRISVSIKEGEKFTVTINFITAATSTWEVFIKKVGEINTIKLGEIYCNDGETSKTFTAPYDIESVGFYFVVNTAGTLNYTFKKTSNLFIFKSGEQLNNISIGYKNDLEGNNLSKNRKLLNKTLIGNGNTVVQTRVDMLIPDNDYVLYFKNPNWNTSEIVDTSYYLFELFSYDDSNNITRLVGYMKSDYGTIPKATQIHIPSNSKSIIAFIRADTNVEVDFCFVDVSFAIEEYNRLCSVNGLLVQKDCSGITTGNLYRLSANKTYTLRITSPTGVSWAGIESQISWIEVYYNNNGSYNFLIKLSKTDIFEEEVVTFTPPADCDLVIGACRIQNEEILRLELFDAKIYNYSLSTFQQVLSASQRQQVIDNLDLDKYFDSVGLLVRKSYSGITAGNIYSLTANKTYVAVITSPTGVSWNGTASQEAWIEVWYNDGTFKFAFRFGKNDIFKEKAARFTPLTNCTLTADPIRIHDDETVIIELFDADIYDKLVRVYPQDFTDKEKLYILNNLGLRDIDDIVGYNEDAIDLVKTAQTKLNTYGQLGYDKYPSILVITDSHGDWTRINRGLYLGEESVFDSVLHLGDIVDGSGQFNDTSWENLILSSSKPVLAIPGNHEYEYVPNSFYIGLTDAETRSILYSDSIISHNGEVHPTINNEVKNYYYKDIQKNGYKLRLIALYQFEWNSPVDGEGHPIYGDGVGKDMALYSQEQIDWLIETLQNTTSDYGVVIMSHMPLSMFKYNDNEFVINSLRNTIALDYDIFTRLSNKYFFQSIIDTFVNGGQCIVSSDQETPDGENHPISVSTTFTGSGKFVCNICGHLHNGGNGYIVDSNDNITNYRVIICPTASAGDTANSGWIGRATEGKLQDCLDSIIYNFDLDKLYLVRFGSTINSNLKEIKSIVI